MFKEAGFYRDEHSKDRLWLQKNDLQEYAKTFRGLQEEDDFLQAVRI